MRVPPNGFLAGLDDSLETLLRVGFPHRVLANLIPEKIKPDLSLRRQAPLVAGDQEPLKEKNPCLSREIKKG